MMFDDNLEGTASTAALPSQAEAIHSRFISHVALVETGSVTLDEFVQRYPPRSPRRVAANPDEMRVLGLGDGVVNLPTEQSVVRRHPHDADAPQGKYLWVFVPTTVPSMLELAVVSPPLASGVVKHTNLAGAASCGGELWFDPTHSSKLYVNGGSGRFGPTTEQHLEDAVSVFTSRGYQVVSFGWTHDNDQPARVLRHE